MTAVCPHCSASFEIDSTKLPAARVRLRCNHCTGVFPYSVENELPSLAEATPLRLEVAEPPEAVLEGEIIDVREVSREAPVEEFVDDEATERGGPTRFPFRPVIVVTVALFLGGAVFLTQRGKQGVHMAMKATESTSVPMPPRDERKPLDRPRSESEVIRLLNRAKSGKGQADDLPAAPPDQITRRMDFGQASKKDWQPFQRKFDEFTPSTLQELRPKLSEAWKDTQDLDGLGLLLSETHAYLGMREGKESWIQYAWETSYLWAQRHPGDIRGSRAEALALLAARQFEKALPLARAAAQVRPDDPVSLYALGKTLNQGKWAPDGLRVLEDAFQRFPKSFAISEALAEAYLAKEAYGKAEQLLRLLFQRESKDLQTSLLYGKTLEGQGKWLDVSLVYEPMVQRFPSSGRLRLALGRAYRRSKQFDNARTQLKEAEGLKDSTLSAEERIELHRERAKVEFDSGRYADSIPLFEAARRQDPKDAPCLEYLAGALYREKRYSEAAEVYEEASKLSPKNLMLLKYYGMSLLESGENAKAEKALQKLVRMGEEDPSLLYHLARIREAAGDKSGAIAYLEQAIRKDPGYENARIRLDKLLSH